MHLGYTFSHLFKDITVLCLFSVNQQKRERSSKHTTTVVLWKGLTTIFFFYFLGDLE